MKGRDLWNVLAGQVLGTALHEAQPRESCCRLRATATIVRLAGGGVDEGEAKYKKNGRQNFKT